MNPATLTIACLVLFSAASLFYVYRFRGEVRFNGVVEYLRKGWPIFAPLNVLLYMLTKKSAKKPILDMADFKELNVITENWQVIKEEALNLYEKGYFDSTTNKENSAFYDVGFRTFYKYGWSKFYTTWYGTTHKSALELCPKTSAILKNVPSVNGSMFTILPPHSQLTRHLDPIACSLRYHLGLFTPNDDNCFINVDGKPLSWRDGEAFMFDETYLHFVKNNTDEPRLILMCDVERPMNWVGRIFNAVYKLIQAQLLVPNLPGDKAGSLNKIFSSVTPFLAWSKELKRRNKKLYLPLKWTFNTLLLLILLGIIYGIIAGVMSVFG